jgi:membrane protein DedA with SNARE-associated domain
MVHKIMSAVAGFVISVISTLGYGGIVVLMAIESANIPLPSEIIMPFSGYLVHEGRFNLWLAGLAGGLGCMLGSWVSYYIGYYGGRPFILKYGKYVLFSRHDLDLADRWFQRWGDATAFFSRLLPVVRTFISLPAGIARANLPRFLVYSYVGSVIWSTALAYIGMKMGQHWEDLKRYFHGADTVIALLILAGVVFWIYRHVRHLREGAEAA